MNAAPDERPHEGTRAPAPESVSETVRRKAERMRAGRRRRPNLFRELAHVGVLGWVFILPVVGFAALGRFAAVSLDRPGLAFAGVGIGLFAGGWAAYLSIRRSLRAPTDAHPHEPHESDVEGGA